jgi:5-(carboxyamino)imidazole ribonucleotide mutase
MPKGIPVATVAIGNAENAGLLAVRMLASRDPELGDKYDFFFSAIVLQILKFG